MASRAKTIGSATSKPQKQKVVKVAIIGGGCAGLAAAWQLAKLNRARDLLKDAREKEKLEVYDITVYESTWRLGGKGASVRDVNGRILEHGLHVWLGFYENAFRMMRECFDELAVRKRGGAKSSLLIDTFDEAFVPEPHIGVASRTQTGDWNVWSAFLPPMKGQPGDPIDEATNPFTWWGYLSRAVALAKGLMQSVLASAADPTLVATSGGSSGRSMLDEGIELDFNFDPLKSPNIIVGRMARMIKVGMLTTAAGVLPRCVASRKLVARARSIARRRFDDP